MEKFFLILLLASFSISVQAKKVYVNSLQITPTETDSLNAKKLDITIPRGTAVEQIETKNTFSKIQYKNQEGWVPSIVLTEKEPLKKVSTLNNTDVDISKSARKRASGYTSAAAARGLTESGKKRINSLQAPDYEALNKMEKGKAKEKEAVEFVNKKEEEAVK